MSHYKTSVSFIIPSVKALKMLLSSQGPSSHGIKTMKQEMLESLNQWFAKVEVVKIVSLPVFWIQDTWHMHFHLTNAKDWLKERRLIA